jgi:hypothetical protein
MQQLSKHLLRIMCAAALLTAGGLATDAEAAPTGSALPSEAHPSASPASTTPAADDNSVERSAAAQHFAESERSHPGAARFRGGSSIVIFGSTTALLLAIILIVLLV